MNVGHHQVFIPTPGSGRLSDACQFNRTFVTNRNNIHGLTLLVGILLRIVSLLHVVVAGVTRDDVARRLARFGRVGDIAVKIRS